MRLNSLLGFLLVSSLLGCQSREFNDPKAKNMTNEEVEEKSSKNKNTNSIDAKSNEGYSLILECSLRYFDTKTGDNKKTASKIVDIPKVDTWDKKIIFDAGDFSDSFFKVSSSLLFTDNELVIISALKVPNSDKDSENISNASARLKLNGSLDLLSAVLFDSKLIRAVSNIETFTLQDAVKIEGVMYNAVNFGCDMYGSKAK